MTKLLLSIFIGLFSLNTYAQCSDYTVQIFSYVAAGGPTSVSWQIEDLENNVLIPGGTVTFSAFSFQQTIAVCLEPGCYNLDLDGNTILTQNNFVATVVDGETILYPTNDLDYGSMSLNYNFCTDAVEPTCVACFTPLVYNGVLNVNNCSEPVNPEFTTFNWSFGDNTTGDGPMPVHTYLDNGIYEICVVMIVSDGEGISCVSEMCQVIEVSGLEISDCPVSIGSGQAEGCGVMNFEIGSFVEGEEVTWFPGDESGAIEGGHFFSHTYEEPGYYNVCAFYTSPACPDGVELCAEILVVPCENYCPTSISYDQIDCNSFIFHLIEGYEGNVTWNFGDGITENASNAADHSYSENGNYMVIAEFSGPGCLLGTTLYFEVEVLCEAECPNEIVPVYHCEDGTVTFTVVGLNDDASMTWWWGDFEINTDHPSLTLETNNEVIFLCVWSDSLATEGCPQVCSEFNLSCEEGCNLNIDVLQDGCEILVLSASGVPNIQTVMWSINGDIVNQGNITTFELSPGANQICAWFEGEMCGDEWCSVFYGCDFNECPEEIWAGAGDECGVMHFEVGGFVDDENVVWYPGDESGAVEGGSFFTHTYSEPGVYNVCAFYTSPFCEGAELCVTIIVATCDIGEGCPDEIWHSENDCGYFEFEVGNFQEGESVDWYLGDVLLENEGHFITYQFETEGSVDVCAYYTSSNCPDGVWLCATVYVSLCEECTDVAFSLDSFVGDEGPTWVTWTLADQGGIILYEGSAQFNFEDTGYEEGLCLASGCYVMNICSTQPFNLEAFDVNFSENWSVVYAESSNNFFCYGYSILLSLNSDCDEQECNNIVLGIDSYTVENGVYALMYNVYDMDGNVVADGESEYNDEDPYYDTNLCLPDGCYTVVIQDAWTGEFSYENLQTFVSMNGQPLPIVEELYIEGELASFVFSLNGECQNECSENEVTVVITSSYIEAGTDLFNFSLSYENIPIELQELITCAECPDEVSYTFCIPDGCYEVELNTEFPLNAEFILVQAYMNGIEIPDALLEMIQGDEMGTLWIGVNSDCENFVNEDSAISWYIFPNPATSLLNISIDESAQTLVRIFDTTGRLALETQLNGYAKQIDISSLSAGVYSVILIQDDKISSKLLEVVK